jgi:hypothetical protein
VTAAFVLLCHVYCACGAARASVAAPAASTVEAAAQPPCHRHHGVGGNSDRGNPLRSGHDGGSCQHCKPSAAVGIDRAKPGSHLAPAELLSASSIPPILFTATPVAHRNSAPFFELPPPQQGRTLLRLHCALNT